jgi:sulfur carrier protein
MPTGAWLASIGSATNPNPAVSESRLSLLVNGEPRAVAAGSTLGDLVAALGLEGRRVAVAVNRNVVPRRTFAVRQLAAGDRIEILEAVGGG